MFLTRFTFATLLLLTLALLSGGSAFLILHSPASEPVVAANPAPKPAHVPESVPASLEGEWQVLRAEDDGRPVPEVLRKALRVLITDRQFVVRDDDLAVNRVDVTYRLDPAVSPRRIEFTFRTRETVKGIYHFEGDRLTVVYNENVGDACPMEFRSRAGKAPTHLLVLRRNATAGLRETGLREQLQRPQWVLQEIIADAHALSVFLETPGAFSGNPNDPSNWIVWHGGSPLTLYGLVVAADADILIDGKKGKFTDLQAGMRVALRLAKDKTKITRLEARSPSAEVVLRAVNARQRAITVELRRAKATLTDLTVTPTARIQINGKRGNLADLKLGMALHMTLVPGDGDRLVVRRLEAVSPAHKE
jgi:uncharacterized protein (TIGR03067 family)